MTRNSSWLTPKVNTRFRVDVKLTNFQRNNILSRLKKKYENVLNVFSSQISSNMDCVTWCCEIDVQYSGKCEWRMNRNGCLAVIIQVPSVPSCLRMKRYEGMAPCSHDWHINFSVVSVVNRQWASSTTPSHAIRAVSSSAVSSSSKTATPLVIHGASVLYPTCAIGYQTSRSMNWSCVVNIVVF